MRTNLEILWNLCSKDIRLFLKDGKSVAMFFIVPILLASVFGYIFSKPLENAEVKLPLMVVVEDESSLAKRLGDALLKSPKLQAEKVSREQAIQRIQKRKSRLALVIPADFSQLLKERKSLPSVEILHHPGSNLEAKWAEGLFTEMAFREAAPELLGIWLPGGAGMKLERPFEVKKEPIPNRETISSHAYSHSFNGMTLQYLLFWGMDCGLTFLREQRLGIWKRLRSAPIPMSILLLGKVLSTSLLALIQMMVTFAFGAIFFGISINGSVFGFVAMILAAALMAAATGLLVAALGGTENSARSVSILAILTLSMVGGMWLPSFMFPEWVQRLALVAPTAWMLRGLEGATFLGMGFQDVMTCAGVVFAFSVVFILLANWRFRSLNSQGFSEGGSL